MIKQLLFMLKPSETENYWICLCFGQVPVPSFKFESGSREGEKTKKSKTT